MREKYSIEKVFDLLGEDALNIQQVVKKNRTSIEVDGFDVYRESLRYAVFYQKGMICPCCGRKGAYFKLDVHNGDYESKRRHFNLYSKDGVLFTKDHILPKKLGGQDTIENLQPMCVECNKEKGTKADIKVNGIIATNIDNPEIKKQYLTLEEAVFDICQRKKLFMKGLKQGQLAKKVITETLALSNALDKGIKYNNYIWTREEFIWKGESN